MIALRISVGLPIVVAATVACHPHYRDDQVRGREAGKAKKLLDKAWSAKSSGDHKGCARLARRAIALNARAGSGAYASLASCQFDAGQHARARATARRGLDLYVGDSALRDFLITAYRSDGFTANTLDFVEPPSIAGAKPAGLTELEKLVEAVQKVRVEPMEALETYTRWLLDYGVPDHRLIRGARDRLLAEAARDERVAKMTAELMAHGEKHLAAGEADVAILFFSQAYRYTPESSFFEGDHGFFRAARSLKDPREVAPVAILCAQEGNKALRKQKLGPAIRHYRRAVAAAPWWAVARRNLGYLLSLAGQGDEATRQFAWAKKLEGR